MKNIILNSKSCGLHESTNGFGLVGIRMVLLLALFMGAVAPVYAASRKRGGEAEVKEEAPKGLAAMNLKELREYQKFVYRPGQRDPFTFRLPEIKKDQPVDVGPVEVDPGEDTMPVAQGAPVSAVQEAELWKWYRTIRAHIIAAGYDEALEIADAAKGEVEKWGGVSSERSRHLYERVLSLRATAQRLANREAVQAEFEALPLNVDGVRWSPKGSAALVNNTVVEPGMTLQVGPEATLLVESIEEDGVIFIFKGQRLRKQIKVGTQID